MLNPWTVRNQRILGAKEGIWARDVRPREERREMGRSTADGRTAKGRTNADAVGTEEKADAGMGSRWQVSGAWAVDSAGVVRWGGKAKSADDVPDLERGVEALGL